MHYRNKLRLGCALIGLLAQGSTVAAEREAPDVAPFSTATAGGSLPAGWITTDIKGAPRRTNYSLVGEDGSTVLRADADSSASAVVHKVRTPVAGHPMLHWRWKVNRVLASSNPTSREGDDYAARVYVMFDYPLERLPLRERLLIRAARAFHDPDVPAAALCYVWDSRLPPGTVLASPYTPRVRIIVVDSGARHAGEWRTVERDVADDFRRAFGEDLPAISAIAVATDTDNTREQVTAWYGDIVLRKRIVTDAGAP